MVVCRLLLLVSWLAVLSTGYPTRCYLEDDTIAARLEYQACLYRNMQRGTYYPDAMDELEAMEDDIGDEEEDVDEEDFYDSMDVEDDEDDGGLDLQPRSSLRQKLPVRKLLRMLNRLQEYEDDSNIVTVKKNAGLSSLPDSDILKMVSDYYQWRKRNGGIGSSSGRWGRSIKMNKMDVPQIIKELKAQLFKQNNGRILKGNLAKTKSVLGRLGYIIRRGRALKKRSETEVNPVISNYKQWREENGYGKSSGRWG